MNPLFKKGLYHGIPICLGYLSVSFGFGIMSVRLGIGVLETVLISLTNLTSAGQAAGVGIIAAAGGLIEMVMTQLVINIRYALMALSLSQKLSDKFNTPRRMIVAFGITDEIFAVSSVQKGKIEPIYMYGLILISALGWTVGTALGAAAGSILPQAFTDAMGLVLYGMFLAIIIPPARESRSVLCVVIIAAVISVLFYYVFTAVSSGFAIIISSVVAALICAWIFPIPEEEAEET
ncbi:MAG: AzlC family ABC transporter permease [Oscillospiraceae bacterium]|nr:AzlC family ABC transporter permease [Oscillospiraceae bacterium]